MMVHRKLFVYNKESQILKSVSLKVGFINSFPIISDGADLFRELNVHKFHGIYLLFWLNYEQCHLRTAGFP